jgi:hypothetical protein
MGKVVRLENEEIGSDPAFAATVERFEFVRNGR